MQRAVLVICLLVASTWADFSDSRDIYSDSDVTVTFEGDSGKMKVWRTSGGNKGDDRESSMEIAFDTLQEQDNKGKDVGGGYDFKTKIYNWTDPVKDGNKLRVTLDAVLDNGADWQVVAELYQEDVDVTWGNTTYTVKKNHVKFSFTITNWKWSSPTDTLAAGVSVKFKGGDKQFPKDLNKDGKDKSGMYVGSGEIDLVNQAKCDGVWKDISTTVYTKGSVSGVSFSFPHFDNKLEYDPSFGLTGAAAKLTVGLGMLATVMLALVNSL